MQTWQDPQPAPASEQEYWTWANSLLDSLNAEHEGHGTTYTNGCRKCLLRAVRQVQTNGDKNGKASAFIASTKAAIGLTGINAIIQSFALAMGDNQFVREIA